MKLLSNIKALSYGVHASIWYIVVATVVAERVKPFKAFLAGLTGHHWTAKGVISLVLFVVVALIFSKVEESQDLKKTAIAVLVSSILGALVIFIFYMLHFYGLA